MPRDGLKVKINDEEVFLMILFEKNKDIIPVQPLVGLKYL